MIRRTTWLARLLSVATGPLILGGCATQTVVFDPATGPAGISAQPGRSGLVIAAPHGTSDGRTADIAADLGRRTGFGIVIATGFAIEPDTRERAGRRDQVNRPTEGVPGRPPARSGATSTQRSSPISSSRPPLTTRDGSPGGRGVHGGGDAAPRSPCAHGVRHPRCVPHGNRRPRRRRTDRGAARPTQGDP